MAKGLFKNFPTTVYDNDGSGSYKQVTDIFRRVSLRSDLKTYIQTYDLQNIDGTQKPERLANLAHGDPNRNWIVMMMNDVENPYSDWFMSEEEFYNYMKKKYPNRVITVLVSNTIDMFLPGEKLYIISDGQIPPTSEATAEIIKFDITLKSITYKLLENSAEDPNNPNDNYMTDFPSSTTTLLYGSSSETLATIQEAPIDEMYGPHHIEHEQERTPILDADGNDIGGTYTEVETVITNWEYEEKLNEAKSQVALLDNSYLDRVEDEFKKKIK